MFAPKLKIKAPDGTSKGVQQFLQDAFLDMYAVVASTLGDVEGVLGFEVSATSFSCPVPTFTLAQIMNEPHRGYIDLPSLYRFDYNTDLHLSYVRECALTPSAGDD